MIGLIDGGADANAAAGALSLLLDLWLKGLVLLGLLFLVMPLLRRASAAARHLAWSIVLCCLLFLPLFSLLMPTWPLGILPAPTLPAPPPPAFDLPPGAWEPAIGAAPVPAPAPLPMPAPPPSPDAMAAPPGWGEAAAPPARPARAAQADGSASAAFGGVPSPYRASGESRLHPVLASFAGLFQLLWEAHWSVWVLFVWLAGVVFVLLQLLVGAGGIWWVVRHARPVEDPDWLDLAEEIGDRLYLTRPVRLLKSSKARMPMTWGTFRPVVLLSGDAAEWTEERRRCVLLHEFAHVKRWDCLTQMLAQLACALHWFNPLAWIAARNMRMEREKACDDYVLTAGRTKASAYAGHLLEVARTLPVSFLTPLGAVSMARPSQLEGRVLAILDTGRRRAMLRPETAVRSVLLAVLLILPFAAVRPWRMPATAAVLASVSYHSAGPSHAEDPFVWSEELRPGQVLTVKNLNGDILAEAATGRKAQVIAYVEDEAAAAVIEIRVERRADGYILCTVPKGYADRADACTATADGRERSAAAEVEFVVSVPDGVSFAAWSVNGDIAAHGLGAPVQAETRNGDIALETRRGAARASSTNGDVSVSMAHTDWEGIVEVTSENGDVAVQLPATASTTLEIQLSRHGSVASAFPLQVERAGGEQWAKATLGQGGRRLVVRSRNGDVALMQVGRAAAYHYEDDAESEDDGARERAAQALLEALEGSDAAVRLQAMQMLGEMGYEAAVPVLARLLRQDADVRARTRAAWALGEIDSPDAVDALIAALQDPEAEVRRMAAWALGEMEDPRAVEPLAARARREPEAGVRQMIAWALGEIDDPRGLEGLHRLLQDESLEVRRKALWALGEIDDPGSIPALVAALRDADAEIRRQAAWALGEIEDGRAVEPLLRALRDAEPEVRRMAAWALAEIEDPLAVEALGQVLREDASAPVRQYAAWALGEIGDLRAVDALTAALKDGDPEVRRKAAWALGQLDYDASPQSSSTGHGHGSAEAPPGDFGALVSWAANLGMNLGASILEGLSGTLAELPDRTVAAQHGVEDDPAAAGRLRAALEGLGYPGLTADELIQALVYEVDPEFVRSILRCGYQPSFEELVTLRIFGVEAPLLAEMAALGYRQLTIDEVVQLRLFGIDGTFVRSLQESGYGKPSVEQLVQLRLLGSLADHSS